jgi:V/A-type H+-transporting ATPase subunit F
MGYRLLGIDETHIVSTDEEIGRTIQQLMSSKEFGLIIASQSVRKALAVPLRESVESSVSPLVLFMPALEGNIEEESISSLAKRVLGINIQMG